MPSDDLSHVIAAASAAAPPLVLATLVKLEGSGYRRAGARMLLGPEGRLAGAISGGCLESDLVARAAEVLDRGESRLVVYDGSGDDELIFGAALGCRGIASVLLEPLETPAGARHLAWLAAQRAARRRGIVASVIATDAPAALPIGLHVFIGEDGQAAWTQEASGGDRRDDRVSGASTLVGAIARDARAALGQRAFTRTYTRAGNRIEVAFLPVTPPTRLALFGAGHDALPLVHFAKRLGWEVHVADHRPAYAEASRFPEADAVLCRPAARLAEALACDESTAVVVMTHHFPSDQVLLEGLLQRPLPYLGVLGPRARTRELLADCGVSADQLPWLHAPIGLDIGAESPEEIALAILAEIQAVLAGRAAGFLRDRPGAIHPAEAPLGQPT